jgi:hypothetical protein
MALTSAEASCSACGAPANKTCQGCLDGIDAEGAAAPRTVYCSADCQKKHWDSHKTVCKRLKVRKELYRAGDLTKKVCYTFRAHAFGVPLRKIEQKGDQIHLHAALNQPEGDEWKAALSDHRVKEAALAWCQLPASGASSDGMLYMGQHINRVLKGMVVSCHQLQKSDMLMLGSCETMVAARVAMKMNRPLFVAFHTHVEGKSMQGNINNAHQVLKVILKNEAGVFALDMAGAQFGYFDSVMPWDRYVSDRVDGIKDYQTPKEVAPKMVMMMGINLWLQDDEELQQQRTESLADALTVSFDQVLKKEGAKGMIALQLPEKAFQEKLEDILYMLNNFMRITQNNNKKDLESHNKWGGYGRRNTHISSIAEVIGRARAQKGAKKFSVA